MSNVNAWTPGAMVCGPSRLSCRVTDMELIWSCVGPESSNECEAVTCDEQAVVAAGAVACTLSED